MAYEDNVLLRLKRQYSKDESLSFILDRLKKAEMEIGYLKSEIAEKDDEILNLKAKKDAKIDSDIINKLNHYEDLKEKVKQIDQGIREKVKREEMYSEQQHRLNVNKEKLRKCQARYQNLQREIIKIRTA